MKNAIKTIGFDADDTLWENEPFFREAEYEFCKLFDGIKSANEVMKLLFEIEVSNLTKYGYGSKAFILSMIETTLRILGNKTSLLQIQAIMDLGKNLLNHHIKLIDGVEYTLKYLYDKYRLILITKGDLLEQEHKLDKSGLSRFFHHIEILSEKNLYNYKVLLKHLDIKPKEFLMVGNSLKSDIEPILKLNSYGAYIPFHITWEHEKMDIADISGENFIQLDKMSDLVDIL